MVFSLLFYSRSERACHLSAAGAKDLLFCERRTQQVHRVGSSRARCDRKQVLRSRACRIGGWFSLLSIREASGPVILSAAGAKDLLFCERRNQQVHRIGSSRARCDRKQVLRSRAFRALAQDDNARPGL